MMRGLNLPALPGSILGGASTSNPAALFSGASQGFGGLINSQLQQSIAQQQAQAQASAGTGQLLGTLGGAALMAFT